MHGRDHVGKVDCETSEECCLDLLHLISLRIDAIIYFSALRRHLGRGRRSQAFTKQLYCVTRMHSKSRNEPNLRSRC
jgi:hypothetical protein